VRRINRPPRETDSAPDVAGNCTICGANSEAFWDGAGGIVEVCQQCAIETLPALIADAAFVPPPSGVNAHDSLCHQVDRFEKAFWKSVAFRLLQERKEA